MKLFSALFLSLAGFVGSAQAAHVVPTENLFCTKDLNSWGHSSSCRCPSLTKYDQRVGACVVGKTQPILISGSIDAQLNDQGDVTGIAFTAEKTSKVYKLIVQRTEVEKLAPSRRSFEVEGETILLPGPGFCEASDKVRCPSYHRAIIVNYLGWLD